jgi:hypothetical protein
MRELERRELVPAARVAVNAVLTQLRGDQDEAEQALIALRHTVPPRSADPHVWAAATIAAALHGYATGAVSRSVEPVAMVRQLCTRASSLHHETMELLCLSLALLARAGNAPVLASFLLGHLTDTLGGVPVDDGSTDAHVRLAGTFPATYAAAGLCIVSLGDVNGGYRLLVRLVDTDNAVRMPLVTGLVEAELARLELEHGTRSSALPWITRTGRFCKRYACDMPERVTRAALAALPAR